MENTRLHNIPPSSPSKSLAQSSTRLSDSQQPPPDFERDDDETLATRQDWASLPSLLALIEMQFGTAEQRATVDAHILTRTKAEQRIFGYAKEYLTIETNRLANGYKKLSEGRNQLFVLLDEAERRRDLLFQELARQAQKLRLQKLECSKRLAEAEAKLAGARRQAGLAKGKLAQEQDTALRAALAQEEMLAQVASLRSELDEARGKIGEAERRAQTAETVAAGASKSLAASKEALRESAAAHDKELARLKEEMARATAAYELKLAGLGDELASVIEQLKAAHEAQRGLEQEQASARVEAEKQAALLATYRERCDQAEAKLNSRDGNMERALVALGQSQQYSQERIEVLSKDKAKLEVRVDELQTEAKQATARLFEAQGQAERAKLAAESLAEQLRAAEQGKAELETRAAQNAQGLEEARSEAATKAARLAEARDATERALQQAEAERARAEQLRQELARLETKAARAEEELAVCQLALQQQRSMSGEELRRLMEHTHEQATAHKHTAESSSLREDNARLKGEMQALEERNRALEAQRRRLHDELQTLKGNVRVVARIRPCSRDPGPSQLRPSVDGASLVLDVGGDQVRSGQKPESHPFGFNRVFGPEASQLAVFEEVSAFVQSALDGYNVCLFSYGQTGSGKTYTMMGDRNSFVHRGIAPRSVDQILAAVADLRNEGWEYVIEASFVEIYNDEVRDLLATDFKNQSKHEIVHANGNVYAKGVRKVPVSDSDQIHSLLSLAERNRAVAATDKNSESSRSHSIFTMHLVGRNTRGKTSELVGSLSLCDLAGSERLKTSHAEGDRLKETQGINTSLSALTSVFSALSQKAAHVPFRNSSLTHLLSPCLSGDGKTLMIVNLSADHADAAESLCSLRFAQTVNKTELGRAKKNVREVSSQQPAAAVRGRVNSMV